MGRTPPAPADPGASPCWTARSRRDAAPSDTPVTRRDALRALGLGLLAAGPWACGAGAGDEDTGPGNAGSAEAATLGEDTGARQSTLLGVQLYTLRDAMAEDVEATLARVADIGYREVEFAGYFGRTPRQIRDALDAAGLASPSTHVGIEAFDDWPATLEAAGIMGHETVVVPSLPQDMRASLDAWRRTAERFQRAGEEARAAGIDVAFHNHAPAATTMEGRLPLDVFLEATEPGMVGVQADVYWLLEGGADPVAFLDRWPGRVPSLHVKGRAADGSMVDVGAGAVDWPAVMAAAGRARVRHRYVEHDRPGDAFASVRSSFDYLRSIEPA